MSNEETQGTATEAPAPAAKNTKKASKKTAKGKTATAKKGAKKAAKGGGAGRFSGEEKITVITKDAAFRGNRAKKFSLLKTGMTVRAALDAIEKAKMPTGSGFLRMCSANKLIKIA